MTVIFFWKFPTFNMRSENAEKTIEKKIFVSYVIASELIALICPYQEENTCHRQIFIDEKIKKATVGVNLICKLNLLLPLSSLLTVYKCFIRHHLGYGDVIYNQPNLSCLTNKVESVQYNVALAIAGAIRGTWKEKLYQELGFESLKDRRWLRRLCYLYKIVSTKQPAYLYDLIPPFQRSSRNKGCIYEPFCRNVSFKNSFLPYAIKSGIN